MHRRLEQKDLLSMVFFFLFGAMILFVTCSMSRSSRRAEEREQARREEQQRQEIENTIKMMQLRRKHLRRVFKKMGLATLLKASNFKPVSAEKSDDIEQGITPETNITSDKDNDSTSRTTLPHGQDEKETHAWDQCHPSSSSVMKSEDCSQSGTTGQGGALQSIDKEPYDALALELGEVQLIRKASPMSIPILCPICLENYKEGETVIVSSNISCTHGFHQECILDYLVRHERGSYPCPCCRQVFLSTETMSDVWKNGASASHEVDTDPRE